MAEFARTLERYDVIDHIATGGMAEVFLGKAYGSHGFEKTIAIKRILPEFAKEPEFERRFVAEAKMAARLTHNNIVQVLDFGRFGETLFIAMEFVDGPDLATFMHHHQACAQPAPLAAAMQISLEMLRGLDYAHLQGVVHRDVSPSNILLSRSGEVKLADFGIALAHASHHPAGGGQIVGKWRYMSPEQACGEPLDLRSDVFSAAIVCYELFTGEKLFDGKTPPEIVEAIQVGNIPLMHQRRPDLPPALDAIIRKALQRDPAHRPSRALEIIQALTELSYEARIVASAHAVAEVIATRMPKRAADRLSADELIKKHLLPVAGAPMERATEVEEVGSSASGLTTQVFVHRHDVDGLTHLVPGAQANDAAPQVVAEPTRVESPRARTASQAHLPPPSRHVRRTLAVVGALVLMASGVWWAAVLRDDTPVLAYDARNDATLEIASTPSGAQVHLNGVVLGVTPLVAIVPSDQAVVVDLTAPGYKPYRWERMTPSGVRRTLDFVLERSPSRLQVTSRPAGGTVTLGGIELGKTPLDLEVPAQIGASLAVALAGYERRMETVDLVAGETIARDISLLASQRTGLVNLHIEEGWADVWFRSKLIGRAPIEGLVLPEGLQRLRLENPVTGRSKTISVRVSSKKPAYVATKL